MFTRAVVQMGVSQSALSQTVRTLERRLDRKPESHDAERVAHRGRQTSLPDSCR